MSDNKPALLLINRHSRQGKENGKQAVEQLQSLGLQLIEEFPQNAQELPDIIRNYQNQVNLVIVGGGDGTVNATAEGLVDTKLPLGILPLGTANDLARTLNIPSTLSEACQVIATGEKNI